MRRAAVVSILVAIVATSVAAWVGSGCAKEVSPGAAEEPVGSSRPGFLRFTIETDSFHEPAARLYADQLSAVGVRATVQVLPREKILQRALAGESDACLVGWSGGTPDPGGQVTCKLIPGGAENFSGYSSPDFDRLLAGFMTRPQAEERASCARAAQEMLAEEAPWVRGFSHPLFDAAAAALQGWRAGPSGRVDLSGASFTDGRPELVVGLGLGERPFIDPFASPDPEAGVVLGCLFDALARLGPDGRLEPALAESWELSADARRLVVKLREGVSFHDGEPLRSSDVVFTYRKVLTGRLPAGLKVTVGADGPLGVVFEFSSPFGGFLDLFGLWPVVPAEYYEAVGPEGFSSAPVGTGPFRYDTRQTRRGLALVRWDGYYAAPAADGPGKPTAPTLRTVTFVFVPDPARRSAMLKAGQIALAPALSADTAAGLLTAGGVKVEREPGFCTAALELDTRRPPFDDARVRLALNYALDAEALVKQLGWEARALPTAFLPEGAGFSPEVAGLDLDRERARTLLGRAGYLVWTPSGP